MHGTDNILEPATAHWFMLPPFLLYLHQRLSRWHRASRAPSKVLKVEMKPGNVLHLQFERPPGLKSYKAGG